MLNLYFYILLWGFSPGVGALRFFKLGCGWSLVHAVLYQLSLFMTKYSQFPFFNDNAWIIMYSSTIIEWECEVCDYSIFTRRGEKYSILRWIYKICHCISAHHTYMQHYAYIFWVKQKKVLNMSDETKTVGYVL